MPCVITRPFAARRRCFDCTIFCRTLPSCVEILFPVPPHSSFGVLSQSSGNLQRFNTCPFTAGDLGHGIPRSREPSKVCAGISRRAGKGSFPKYPLKLSDNARAQLNTKCRGHNYVPPQTFDRVELRGSLIPQKSCLAGSSCESQN